MLQEGNESIMKRLMYLTFLPAVLWMLFIFGFSKDTGEESSSLSLTITQKIVDIVEYNKDITEEEYVELVEKLHTPVRKAAHMTEYAILAILICIPVIINMYVGNIRMISLKQMLFGIVTICTLYAATDELHQLFVSGRTGKATDVIIDMLGAFCGTLIFLCIYKFAYGKIIRKCEQ